MNKYEHEVSNNIVLLRAADGDGRQGMGYDTGCGGAVRRIV